MTANELADGIENCTIDLLHKKVATMLRDQQAEIEALKEFAETIGGEANRKIIEQQALIKELQVSNQSWEIIAKGYGKAIEEQQAEIEALNRELAHYKPNGEMGTVFIFEEEQEK